MKKNKKGLTYVAAIVIIAIIGLIMPLLLLIFSTMAGAKTGAFINKIPWWVWIIFAYFFIKIVFGGR